MNNMNKIITGAIFVSLLVLLASCAKKDDPQPVPTPTPPAGDYIYFFKATMDGNAVEVGQKKLSMKYQNGMSQSGEGDQGNNYQVIQTTYFSDISDDTKPVYSVGMISTFPGYSSTPDYKTRAEAITTGYQDYGYDDPTVVSDGAFVEYWDNAGEYWSTTKGSGNQSGSSFTITSYKDNTDGYSVKIMEAEFNCMLYNQSGASIKVTNGKVKGRIVLY